MSDYTLKRCRKSGRWAIAWTEYDAAAKRSRSRTLSTGTADRAEAERVLAEYTRGLTDLERAQRSPTFGDLARAYVADAQSRGVGVSTMGDVKRLVDFFGGDRPAAIDPARLDAYRASRGAIKDGTLRRELGIMKAVFTFGVKARMIEQRDVPFLPAPPAPTGRTRWLDDDELERWWGAATDPDRPLSRIGLFVAIALETGARRGAILDLEWDRVDMANGWIDYRVPGRRQTRKRRIVSPISQRLAPVLVRARDENPARHPSLLINMVDPQKSWHRWVSAHGLAQDVTPHVLRHSFATRLLRRGVSIWDVAKLLGDTPAMVDRVYGHVAPNDLRRAIDRVA